MRISDWSSDVCSSDLVAGEGERPHVVQQFVQRIDELEQEARDSGHRAADVADGDHARPVELALLPFDVEQHAVAAIVAAHGAADVELAAVLDLARSEEHTSELQSLMRISYAVFCLKKK